jgi:quinol monooxygenase YgiN
MQHVLVRHRVNDYEVWKRVFDDFADTRKEGGEKAYEVFQDPDNSNDLTLLFEWDNRDNADKFFGSSELKSTMQKAGVSEQPTIRYLDLDDKGKL